MAETFDLFSFFEEEETTAQAPKKVDKKKEAPKKEEKKKAATPKAPQGFKCPITVVTGYIPAFSLNSDNFAGKEEGITEAELRTAIERLYPYFQGKATRVSRVNETKALCFLQEGFVSTKGDVNVTEKSVAYLGQIKVPLGGFLKEEETAVPLEELKSKIIPSIRCQLVVGENGIISILPGTRPSTASNFPLPFTVSVLADRRAEVTITREDVLELNAAAAANEEDEEEGEQPTVAEVGNNASLEQIVNVLKAKFPAFADGLKLYDCVEDNKVVGYVVRFQPQIAATPKAPVEETYPVKDLTISLLFKKYHPTEEDFGGLASVTVKQIAKFLRDQGEIDYEDGNTYVSKHSKETNTVVIAFKGGTKG